MHLKQSEAKLDSVRPFSRTSNTSYPWKSYLCVLKSLHVLPLIPTLYYYTTLHHTTLYYTHYISYTTLYYYTYFYYYYYYYYYYYHYNHYYYYYYQKIFFVSGILQSWRWVSTSHLRQPEGILKLLLLLFSKLNCVKLLCRFVRPL